MFNLKARGSLADPKDASKPALKPALYDPPGTVPRAPHGTAARPPAPGHAPAPPREGLPPAPAFPLRDDVAHAAPPRKPPPLRRRALPRRRPGASSSSG